MKPSGIQAEIARAWGVKPARVSQLKRRGMPVDSLASAEAWRRARRNRPGSPWSNTKLFADDPEPTPTPPGPSGQGELPLG